MNIDEIVSLPENLDYKDKSVGTYPVEGFEIILVLRRLSVKNKTVIVKCHKCSQDPEMYGEGLFKTTLHNLRIGRRPCGCSKKVKRTIQQYEILCERACKTRGIGFVGFCEWNNNKTKCKLMCDKHGLWETTIIMSLLADDGRGCPVCNSRKDDSVMIESFMRSGKFPQDTKFWRSERKRNSGGQIYWHFECKNCEALVEATCDSLQRGVTSCLCNPLLVQKQAYINIVNNGKSPVAIKFGIAIDAQYRLNAQNRVNLYKATSYGVWEFSSSLDCRNAESFCKKVLETKIISKSEMMDGYTETTYLYNLEEIVKIYEEYGGSRIY